MMNRKGFSLIELLVVVAIIGILAAVGIVAYSGYTASAKVNAVRSNHTMMIKFISNELAKCDAGIATELSLRTASSGGRINPPCNDFISNNRATYVATTFSAHFEGIELKNVYGCPVRINPSCPQIFSTSQACIGSHNPTGEGCTTITGVGNTITVITCTEDPCGASEKLTDTININ